MTFKKIKFEDSPVMRNFERIAIKKQLIKEEPQEVIKKEASNNDAPTDNFMQNLLILCAKLRENKFDKYAQEIENKLLLLKRAETSLYNVFKETGEDVIEQSHPEGSVKLDKKWSDLGVIENAVDQKKKIQDVVNKKPTGKLANKNIVNALKVLLAQTSDDMQPMRNKYALGQVKRIPSVLSQGWQILSNKMITTTLKGEYGAKYNNIYKIVDGMTDTSITLEQIDSIITELESLKSAINLFNWKNIASGITGAIPSGLNISNVGNIVDLVKGKYDFSLRDQILSHVNNALNIAKSAFSTYRGENDLVVKKKFDSIPSEDTKEQSPQSKGLTEKIDPSLTPLLKLVNSSLSQLNTWKTTVQIYEDKDDVKTGLDFINALSSRLNAMKTAIQNVEVGQGASVLSAFDKQMQAIKNQMDEFYNNWIA